MNASHIVGLLFAFLIVALLLKDASNFNTLSTGADNILGTLENAGGSGGISSTPSLTGL